MITSLKSKFQIWGFGFLGLLLWTLVVVWLLAAFAGMKLEVAIALGAGFLATALFFAVPFIAAGQLAQFLAERFISRSQPVSHSIEDRLDELERLKRRDMVTPEEYAAKRQEILKDL